MAHAHYTIVSKEKLNFVKRERSILAVFLRRVLLSNISNVCIPPKYKVVMSKFMKMLKKCIELCFPKAEVEDNTAVCLVHCFEENIKGKH
jgi:hypothetical protein